MVGQNQHVPTDNASALDRHSAAYEAGAQLPADAAHYCPAHPAYDMIDDDAEQPMLIRRSNFDRTPIDYEHNGIAFTDYRHTMADIYMGLLRANYRVDMIVEPEPLSSGHRSQHWRETYKYVP